MKTARITLMVFFGLVVLNAGQSLFVHLIGFNPTTVFGGSFLLPAVFALVVSTILYLRYLPRLFASHSLKTYKNKLTALIFMVAVLTAYGYFSGNLFKNILADVWIYIVVICFMFLGQYDQVWRDLEKPLIIVFWVGFLMVVFCYSLYETTISRRKPKPCPFYDWTQHAYPSL